MIIIGYQGIGKSSISNVNTGCINLEPGCFWYNGERPEHWLTLYCNTALHLSSQGYTVFITGYDQVLHYMHSFINKETIIAMFPEIRLKEQWIERLSERSIKTGFKKDFDAYEKAMLDYERDIEAMKLWGGKWFEINSMDYDLLEIVKFLREVNEVDK